MENTKVTAVVLNYNSSRDCEKCVRFLKQQDYENISIIIVDNASSNPNEEEALHRICDDSSIRLLFNTTNSGFSAGNNMGLRAAVQDGAEWMLVINPDVELRDPHYISYVMEELPKWPNTAVVGTDILLPSGEKQNPMRELTFFEEFMWPLEKLNQKLGKWNGYRTEDKTGYCEKVSGCCFFISKCFLEKNGYLDESVFMYCEEPILAKSVERLGYHELYIKETTAHHEHYEHKKTEMGKAKMSVFLKSRIYYIANYSNYNKVCKQLSIFSRKVQWMIQKYLK